ncbi:hypothetical protein FRC01_012727, partial [Tulasnella sp. 417]
SQTPGVGHAVRPTRTFTSEVLAAVDDILVWDPISPVQMSLPTSDNDVDEEKCPDTPQSDVSEASNLPKPKKLSAQERLDRLSHMRIDPTAIHVTPVGQRKVGGKAQVMQATFKRGRWGRKRDVAAKKLLFNDSMDKHVFANGFVHEVELMAGLSHENIVRLEGFVEELENRIAWIIMSWEPNGTVSEFLANGKREIPERISL